MSHVVMVNGHDIALAKVVVRVIAAAKVGGISIKENAAQKLSARDMSTG